MLPLGDLIRDLDVRLVAGEAGLDTPVRWVHISELEDPTPWLSGGELLLTTGLQLETPRPSATSWRGWPTTSSRASASAPASRTSPCPRRWGRRPPSATSRSSRCPTTCRSSRSPRRRSRAWSTSSTPCSSARSPRTSASSASSSPSGASTAVVAALATLIGGAGAGLRRARRAARAAHAFAARRSTTTVWRRCATSCASAPATARPQLRARAGELAGRALALPVVRPGTPDGAAIADGRRPGSWRPRTPAACPSSTASRSTRRSRSSRSSCCASASPRTPSAGSPATCCRARLRAS